MKEKYCFEELRSISSVEIYLYAEKECVRFCCAQVNKEIVVRQDFILSVKESFASSSLSVNLPPCALTRAFAIPWHTSIWLHRRSESLRAVFKFKHKCFLLMILFAREVYFDDSGDGGMAATAIDKCISYIRYNSHFRWMRTAGILKQLERGSQNIQHVSIWLAGRMAVRAGETCSNMASSVGLHFCVVIRSFELISTHPKHSVSYRRLHERGRGKNRSKSCSHF